jgi:GTP-binding protein EngB required for normal cell division
MATGPDILQIDKDLLDAVETLKNLQIGYKLELPQLVIVGDQSSGKSSVLEAISGVHFPTRDGLCTRHPTELVLRTGQFSCEVTIRASHDQDDGTHPRSPTQLAALATFLIRDPDLDNLQSVYESAQDLMGIDPDNIFSRDVLRIELTDPKLPNLTLIDLPGFFSGAGPNQTVDDKQVVNDMVNRYLGQERTAILMVVSARNDMATQLVTEAVKVHDPAFQRTIGLLTKPDLLDETPTSAPHFVRLVQNMIPALKLELGWYVVRNRSPSDQQVTLEEWQAVEEDFLSAGRWEQVAQDRKGIQSLRSGLAAILLDVVRSALPELISEAEAAVESLRNSQSNVEDRKVVIHNTRNLLIDVGAAFPSHLLTTLHNTFGQLQGHRGIILNKTNALTKDLANRLQADLPPAPAPAPGYSIYNAVFPPRPVTAELKAEIVELTNSYPGAPGQFNAPLASKLFYTKTQIWPQLLDHFVDDLTGSIAGCIRLVLQEILTAHNGLHLLDGLSAMLVDPAVDKLRGELQQIVDTSVSGHKKLQIIHFLDEMQELIPSVRSSQYSDKFKESLALLRQQTTPISAADWNRMVDDFATRVNNNLDHITVVEIASCYQLYHQVGIDSYFFEPLLTKLAHRRN